MLALPSDCREVFLNPGECHFGASRTRVRTLLGSCVAVTMWHPALRIGGMCHFLVPERAAGGNERLDGRYGTEALLMMIRAAVSANTDPSEYRYKVFGGGNMFASKPRLTTRDVGQRNAEFALAFLETLGHEIVARHVGARGHRVVVFDIWSGTAWLRHGRPRPAAATE